MIKRIYATERAWKVGGTKKCRTRRLCKWENFLAGGWQRRLCGREERAARQRRRRRINSFYSGFGINFLKRKMISTGLAFKLSKMMNKEFLIRNNWFFINDDEFGRSAPGTHAKTSPHLAFQFTVSAPFYFSRFLFVFPWHNINFFFVVAEVSLTFYLNIWYCASFSFCSSFLSLFGYFHNCFCCLPILEKTFWLLLNLSDHIFLCYLI